MILNLRALSYINACAYLLLTPPCKGYTGEMREGIPQREVGASEIDLLSPEFQRTRDAVTNARFISGERARMTIQAFMARYRGFDIAELSPEANEIYTLLEQIPEAARAQSTMEDLMSERDSSGIVFHKRKP